MSLKQTIGTIGIGVGLFGMATLGFMCTYKITLGYAGVVYNLDGGVEEVVSSCRFYQISWTIDGEN